MVSELLVLFIIAGCTRVYSHYMAGNEPKCSKFDFEEKVLEKMVRMEHSSEIMMERFNNLFERVDNNLKTMRDEFEDMKLRIKEDQDYYKQKLDEIHNRPSYAFSTMWVDNTDPSVNDVLVFTRVLLNDNTVYDANTGTFKAPVDGTYMFTAKVCVQGGKYLKLSFLAQDIVIGSFISGDIDSHSCTSSTVISQLQTGHIVKLVVVERQGSGAIVVNRDIGYLSSFVGTLLKQ